MLKTIKNTILEPLSLLFNQSLEEGTFPEIFKLSEVIPLHKGTSRIEVTNYRPILLLLTISKILEKIVHARTYEFLNVTNQLYQSQYGFPSMHACEHAIGELLGEITKNLQHSRFTITTFLDLSKAFDMLQHSVIFKKPECYGIQGITLERSKSYFNNRQIITKVNTKTNGLTYSSEYNIDYGTAQWSCLGPLIFLIFCNDLHLHLSHIKCIQFANDSILYFSHSNMNYAQFCMENNLETLHDWFNVNKLTLNIGKSTCMIFRPKPIATHNSLVLGDKHIPVVKLS